jgi:hypothetical protein
MPVGYFENVGHANMMGFEGKVTISEDPPKPHQLILGKS